METIYRIHQEELNNVISEIADKLTGPQTAPVIFYTQKLDEVTILWDKHQITLPITNEVCKTMIDYFSAFSNCLTAQGRIDENRHIPIKCKNIFS